MKLLTKQIERDLAKQGDTSQMLAEDIRVILHWFNPSGAGDWYVYDRDPEDPDVFWAFANLNDPQNAECGTVSLRELESIKTPPFGLRIERDLYWSEKTLAEVIKEVKG